MDDLLNEIAYLNGQFLPAQQARLPFYDLGVVGGVAVSEMLRTFGHVPFRVTEHLDRLQQSCELTGIPLSLSQPQLQQTLHEVVAHNTAGLDAADDLGVILFVTAGWNPTYVGQPTAQAHGSTVGIHTFPLQYASWTHKYRQGVALRTASIPALPAALVDRRVKSRSRLHWYLADQAVRALEPGALAILAEPDGTLTETAAANLCLIFGRELWTPPVGTALEGVSLQMVMELWQANGGQVLRRRFTVQDALQAQEIWITSTPCCLLPVTRLNGSPISGGHPGPEFARCLQTWGQQVQVDLMAQSRRDSRQNNAIC